MSRITAFARSGISGDCRHPPAGQPFFIVDCFSEVALQGNQLAVFAGTPDLGAQDMLRLARELNFSETSFLLPPRDGGDVRVRIFTPARELDFAGHPVLGSAVVAATALECDFLVVETALSLVPVRLLRRSGRVLFARMRQPLPVREPYAHAAQLLAAVGVEKSLLPIEAYRNGLLHAYVELETERDVVALRPNMRALADLGNVGASCFAGSATRWKTRMFAPGSGIAEDPATGSAAGPLAVHLSRHGRIAFGEEIEIRQGAEIGRPSVLCARAYGSPQRVTGVEVGGSALIVARGEFAIA